MTEFQLYTAMVIQHLVNMYVVTDLLHHTARGTSN